MTHHLVFAEAWVVLRLHLWLLLNIILVSISPISVGGMVFLVHRKRKLHWGKRGWGRLPLAFVLGAASCLVLCVWLNTVNTEVSHCPSLGMFLTERPDDISQPLSGPPFCRLHSHCDTVDPAVGRRLVEVSGQPTIPNTLRNLCLLVDSRTRQHYSHGHKSIQWTILHHLCASWCFSGHAFGSRRHAASRCITILPHPSG